MVKHPDYLFGTPPEHARINPDNPFILVNHLKCAVFELPFGSGAAGEEFERFGELDVRRYLAALEEEGLLHSVGGRWHWASQTYPADHISLRTVTSDNFLVIDTTARDEKQTKRRQIIAEVDWGSAFATIYQKAIYVVESEPYEVQELHFREDEEKVAYVKRVAVDYFTDAVSAKGVWILRRLAEVSPPAYLAEQGEVLVAEKVVGFKKIKMGTLENVGSGEVELPQQEMQTTAAWLTVGPEVLALVNPSRAEVIDGLRAVSYLLHHLAPIFLLCDIRDLGSWLGDTTPATSGVVATRESAKRRLMDADQFNPTIYLYDSHAGGIGLAEHVFEILPDLLRRGLARGHPRRGSAQPALPRRRNDRPRRRHRHLRVPDRRRLARRRPPDPGAALHAGFRRRAGASGGVAVTPRAGERRGDLQRGELRPAAARDALHHGASALAGRAAPSRPLAPVAASVDVVLRRLPTRDARARGDRCRARRRHSRRPDPGALLRLSALASGGAARPCAGAQPGRHPHAGGAARLVRRSALRPSGDDRGRAERARAAVGTGGCRARARVLSRGARGRARGRTGTGGTTAPGAVGEAPRPLGSRALALGGGCAPRHVRPAAVGGAGEVPRAPLPRLRDGARDRRGRARARRGRTGAPPDGRRLCAPARPAAAPPGSSRGAAGGGPRMSHPRPT